MVKWCSGWTSTYGFSENLIAVSRTCYKEKGHIVDIRKREVVMLEQVVACRCRFALHSLCVNCAKRESKCCLYHYNAKWVIFRRAWKKLVLDWFWCFTLWVPMCHSMHSIPRNTHIACAFDPMERHKKVGASCLRLVEHCYISEIYISSVR